jgi:AcrR family transcriptional regulator
MGNGPKGVGGRVSGAVPAAKPTARARSSGQGAAGASRARTPGKAGVGENKAPDKRKKIDPQDGRLVRGRKSRARILAAARELFDERGFDGATLRAIAERAGMGASSIYRHVRSKEELLIDELVALQEEAWRQFREADDRGRPTRERIQSFLDVQHSLFVSDRDFTVIAVRATTHTEARVAKHVFALNDRTIGLLFEILQMGRRDLAKGIDALEAARVIFAITQGARIPWANGMMADDACTAAIRSGVNLLFQGLEA